MSEELKPAALQSQPAAAEVSDAEIIDLAVSCNLGRTIPPLGNPCSGNVFATDSSYRTDELLTFARAILALRPQAAPMTDERLAEVLTTAYGSPEWTMDDVRAARSVEVAALGITAQGAQGEQG